jgi:hypothetical protein
LVLVRQILNFLEKAAAQEATTLHSLLRAAAGTTIKMLFNLRNLRNLRTKPQS